MGLTFGQDATGKLLNARNHLDSVINYNKDEKTVKLYETDIETLDSILSLSSKKYKIIYFYSPTCYSSKLNFPIIKEYVTKNEKYFDMFLVSGHQYDKIPEIKKSLKLNNYYQPVFILDTNKYGNRANPFSRLDKLTKKMCSKCQHNKMGFSAFIVFDEKNNVIGYTNYDYTSEEKLELLKTVTNNGNRCPTLNF